MNNSQWCSDLQSKSPQSRRHALAEAIFNAFPTPAVHLQGATYNINMIAQLLPAAAQAGVLRVPSMAATDQLPLIAGIDVATSCRHCAEGLQRLRWPGMIMLEDMRPPCCA